MWRPMRARGAGTFQLILMAVGLAYLLRYTISLVAGPQLQSLRVDATTSFKLPWGLTFGRTAFYVVVASYCILGVVGAMLRFTGLGKQMRALSDDLNPRRDDRNRHPAGDHRHLAVRRRPRRAGRRALRVRDRLVQPELRLRADPDLFAAVVLGGIGEPLRRARRRSRSSASSRNGRRCSSTRAGRSRSVSRVLHDVLLIRPEGCSGRRGQMSVLAVSFASFAHFDFWLGVGVLAGDLRHLRARPAAQRRLHRDLQFRSGRLHGDRRLRDGASWSSKCGWSFWVGAAAGDAVASLAGLLVGLPSLRLRSDYFAIATIAFAEIVRYVAPERRSSPAATRACSASMPTWRELADWIVGWLGSSGSSDTAAAAAASSSWADLHRRWLLLRVLQHPPWGRVLRGDPRGRGRGRGARQERASPTSCSRWRSPRRSAAIAGCFVALNVTYLYPRAFEPTFTFFAYAVLVLGGFGSYVGVALGAMLLWIAARGHPLPRSAARRPSASRRCAS